MKKVVLIGGPFENSDNIRLTTLVIEKIKNLGLNQNIHVLLEYEEVAFQNLLKEYVDRQVGANEPDAKQKLFELLEINGADKVQNFATVGKIIDHINENEGVTFCIVDLNNLESLAEELLKAELKDVEISKQLAGNTNQIGFQVQDVVKELFPNVSRYSSKKESPEYKRKVSWDKEVQDNENKKLRVNWNRDQRKFLREYGEVFKDAILSRNIETLASIKENSSNNCIKDLMLYSKQTITGFLYLCMPIEQTAEVVIEYNRKVLQFLLHHNPEMIKEMVSGFRDTNVKDFLEKEINILELCQPTEITNNKGRGI